MHDTYLFMVTISQIVSIQTTNFNFYIQFLYYDKLSSNLAQRHQVYFTFPITISNFVIVNITNSSLLTT